jgi:hypothetical protein
VEAVAGAGFGTVCLNHTYFPEMLDPDSSQNWYPHIHLPRRHTLLIHMLRLGHHICASLIRPRVPGSVCHHLAMRHVLQLTVGLECEIEVLFHEQSWKG